MQIILVEKVTNLGQLGDVVKVKDGYARNFLIPQGKAKRATAANMAEFEARRAELEKIQAGKLLEAQGRAAKLEAYVLSLARKAGVDGKLFGSVTNSDIAEGLAANGFDVVKAEVRLPNGPLKSIGDHPVTLSLHTDVSVDISVAITAAA
ncbi:MAG: 50S ribosomal protein L9 [Burkholderiales bacterium]|nr:50S ribosomal protein L9 [Sulfuricellaceae bacterium]